MTIITRSDGQGQQWAYQGHPLYRYAGDSGSDQMNGDLIPDFGGHWHVARPSPATGTGTGGGGGNCGTYC
jgi:predicted lipoprotein with Yx(FWY)xxD motif